MAYSRNQVHLAAGLKDCKPSYVAQDDLTNHHFSWQFSLL